MRTPRVIRTEFSLTIRVRFISSMRKITNNYPDFVLITAITLFSDVSEFFFDVSDFINIRFRVRKAPERRRPGDTGAVAPPVRSKQVIRMSGGS